MNNRIAMTGKLNNLRLRYREKCRSVYYRQVIRLINMLVRHTSISIKQGILKVMIGLTYDCQCRCDYCCAGLYVQEKEKELTTGEVKAVTTDIASLPSLCTLVSFFGGEPLLREDIFALVEWTASKGLFTEVETNGILLSPETVKRLKQTGLHHLFVRVESADAALHDRISHFEGCFERAVRGISHCASEGLSCSISTIASREKVHSADLKKIIDLGRELGVSSVRILYPTRAGRWLQENNQMLTEKEKTRVNELLEPGFVYLESSYIAHKTQARICPSRQKRMFYISCYGEVQPCPFVPLTFGNIRQGRIGEIAHSMWQHDSLRGAAQSGCIMDDSEFYRRHLYQEKQCGGILPIAME